MSAEGDLTRVVLQALRAPTDEGKRLLAEFAALLSPELKIQPATTQLLTLAQVAKMCGRTYGALHEAFRRERKKGNVHFLDQVGIKLDGEVRRWRREDVEAFIATKGGK